MISRLEHRNGWPNFVDDANLAASCQGSTSSRVNAERTLSSIPLLSSQIGANRKSSNLDSRTDIEDRVISITAFRRFCRKHRTDNEAWGALLSH